ncbi:MAG: hypothetical protein ACFE9R_19065 [Candidatus Hermodarchaeota archaeon]
MSDVVDLIIAFAQILLGVGTLVVAYVAYRLSQQIKRVEAHRMIKDAFNTLNVIALDDPGNLEAIDALENPELVNQSIEQKRRRWLGIIMINALESTFIGKRERMLDENYAKATLEALVPIMVRHDEVFHELEIGGHDPEFTAYCKEVRAHLQNS